LFNAKKLFIWFFTLEDYHGYAKRYPTSEGEVIKYHLWVVMVAMENNWVPAGSCPRGAVGTPNQRLMVGTESKYVEVSTHVHLE
jgi:hypothetical protein